MDLFVVILLITNSNCDNEHNSIKLLEILKRIYKKIDAVDKINVLLTKSDTKDGFLYKIGEVYGQGNVKTVLRGKGDKESKILRAQHKRKMEEIMSFLKDHYSSTNYFHSEMLRIQQQQVIKDQMREMIDYLELPRNWKVKKRVLNIFNKLKKKQEEQINLWNHNTNNLVINVMKDPFNDGVN